MRFGTAVREIPRSDCAMLDALTRHGVSTVHEAMGRTGLMQPYMRPIQQGRAVAGNAVTVLVHPGDNWMLHVALELCQPNDVLVVGVTSECTDGMFGDLLATSAMAHGVTASILDAGCRDVAELRRMGFPVWSRAICAKGTIKATLGSVNIPLVCAGAYVHPGDIVVADDDGVVIVPYAWVKHVLEMGEQRLQKEEKKRARLAAGELGMDIEDMRPKLASLGLVYFETLDEAANAEGPAGEPDARASETARYRKTNGVPPR